MKVFKTWLFCLLISNLSTTLFAQQINSDYFIENNPLRQDYNPAFKPKTDYFISLPGIGFTSVAVGNNSLTVKDLVYTANGQTITFKNPLGNTDKLYNVLQPTTLFQAAAKTNILTFGWRIKKDYLTFSIDQRVSAYVGLPKDLFKFILYGTPDVYNNSYNLSRLQTDFSSYTEAGVCFTRRISKQLTLGAKLKLLIGNTNVSNTNSNLSLRAGFQEWTIQGSGSVNYSGGLHIKLDNQLQSLSVKGNPTLWNFLSVPSGIGAGIDLGLNYKLNEDMVLSASLLDIGFINWYKNPLNMNYSLNYNYDGIKQINGNTVFSLANVFTSNTLTDSLLNTLNSAYTIKQSVKNYITSTTAKLNVGFEYKFPENQWSLGLLSHSEFMNQTFVEELTASVNAKPVKWFNGSLSYSVLNGRFSSIGLGFGLRTSFVHWLFGADYLPLQLVTIPISFLGSRNTIVPYNSRSYNLHFGINIVFNKSKVRRMHSRTGLYGYDIDED